MRDPLAPAERRYGQEHIRRQSSAQKVLGELLAISGVPDLFEIGRMQRVNQCMLCFTQKKRIVDGERPVQKRQQQQAGQKYRRRCQAKVHLRGLAR